MLRRMARSTLLKKSPRASGRGCARAGHRPWRHRGLVRRRGQGWPEEQGHPALGQEGVPTVCSARPAHGINLHLRRAAETRCAQQSARRCTATRRKNARTTSPTQATTEVMSSRSRSTPAASLASRSGTSVWFSFDLDTRTRRSASNATAALYSPPDKNSDGKPSLQKAGVGFSGKLLN